MLILRFGNVGVFNNAKDWHSGCHAMRGLLSTCCIKVSYNLRFQCGIQFHASFVYISLNTIETLVIILKSIYYENK